MRTLSIQCSWPCLAALLLAGCATERAHPPVSLPATARLVEMPWGNSTAHRVPEPDDNGIQQVALKPRQVLVLSGGGDNGAYTVGVLKGWTAAGTRPPFDVVTGISAGALVAPFAFLGAEYDATLERIATELRAGDVFSRRLPPALLWADSLADSAPLRRRIADVITPEILVKVALAHAEGRRLYVGTTDLDTKRLVVWDMGAITAGNDPGNLQLFRDVLLASASVPGVLPPVSIDVVVDNKRYTELHVDGGVSAPLFLQPSMVGLQRNCASSAPEAATQVHVILASKLRLPSHPVKRRLFPVFGESIDGLLQSRLEGDLVRVYLLTRFAGGSFQLTAVPADAPDETDNLSFDPKLMRELFDRGYQFGSGREAWLSLPPNVSPKDQQPPRGGINFTVEQVQARKAEATEPAAAGPKRTGSATRLQKLSERVSDDIQQSTGTEPR